MITQRKQILFITGSLETAHSFHEIFAALDVEVVAGMPTQFEQLITTNTQCSLIVYEMLKSEGDLARIENILVSYGRASLFLIIPEDFLGDIHLPSQVPCDFMIKGASSVESRLRILRLLYAGTNQSTSDFIVINTMTINLATYQVEIAGKPLDLTYLEYALLAFLITHSNKTFSRDALLSEVWGFDYYGGSRTVDVHVRRVRAKLGPELAQHLETIRGVGYLWSNPAR